MKCLCFSDSHGSDINIRRALSHHPDAEVVFFLGDGINDILELSRTDKRRAWLPVCGNCDSYVCSGLYEKTGYITLCGQKIAYTHGDLYGVKGGMGGLLSLAKSENCSLVLFGHTHLPFEKYYPDVACGVHLFNPGSCSGSYYDGGCYGVITLTQGGILLSHAKLT